MNEQQFHHTVDALFLHIEHSLEAANSEIDFESEQGILTLTLPDTTKVILSRQSPLQEIWLACKQGAYHFRCSPKGWVTREGQALEAVINTILFSWLSSPMTF